MSAIMPLTTLINRDQRRRYRKEALWVVEDLERVNTEFIYYLFDESDSRTYNELYNHFNILWYEAVKEVVRRHKIRTIGIDLYWFSESYKPLEYE